MPHPEYRNPCDIPGVLRCSGYVDGRNARERALDEAINEEVHDLPGAIRAAAVARYLEQRTAAHEALRSHRVMVLVSRQRGVARGVGGAIPRGQAGWVVVTVGATSSRELFALPGNDKSSRLKAASTICGFLGQVCLSLFVMLPLQSKVWLRSAAIVDGNMAMVGQGPPCGPNSTQ